MNSKGQEINSFKLPTCTRSNKEEQYQDAIRNVHQMSTELGGTLPAETTIIFDYPWINGIKPVDFSKRSTLIRSLGIAIQRA